MIDGKRVLFSLHAFHPNLWLATKVLIEAGAEVRVFCSGGTPHENNSHLTPDVFEKTASFRDVLRRLDAFQPDLALLRWEGNARLATLLSWGCRLRGRRAYEYTLDAISHRRKLRERLAARLQARPRVRVSPVKAPGERVGPDGASLENPRSLFLPLPTLQSETGRPRPRAEGEPLRVVLVGKLSQRRKGHLKTLRYLDTLPPDAGLHLTIVGSSSLAVGGGDEGYLAEMLAEAAKPRPGVVVEILKDVPHAAMPALLQGFDLCLLPAYGERLGYAPLEAMAYGVAPVVTRAAGVAGYVADGENGVILEDSGPEAFARRLTPLLRDRALVERLKANALRDARETLHPERYLENVARLLARP